jgi:hypothetical protein
MSGDLRPRWCFRFRRGQGFFQTLWIAGLETYDEAMRVDWARLCADGCMDEAPLARESAEGKTGANGVFWWTAPDSFQIERIDSVETPRRLRLDKGYSEGPDLELVVLCGFIPHIKSRGQERMGKRRADG